MKNLITRMIYKSNIKVLTTLPTLLALAFLFLTLKLWQSLYGEVSEIHLSITNIGALLISSFSGLIQVIRKEGPGVLGVPVKGLWPVLMGCFWLLLTWGGVVYILYYLISGYSFDTRGFTFQ